MTCREKFKSKYPDWPDPEELGACPDVSHIYTEPINCCVTNPNALSRMECTECWDREIPDTEKIENVIDKFNALPHVQAIAPEEIRHILDSGNRREFGTGAVRDIQEGKGRCDLMPLDVVARYLEDDILRDIGEFQNTGSVDPLYDALWKFAPHWGNNPTDIAAANATMLLEVAKHYEEGCIKYGERNWQKGIPVRCYIDSAVRHYMKFIREDKDENHDRAFCWNLLGAIWTCVHKPELCEYPIKLEG